MQIGGSHFAGHGYGVATVGRKLDRLAVEFPGAAIFSRQLVLVSALGLRQTACQGAHFGVLVLGGSYRRNHQQRGYGDDTQQQFILHGVLPFLNLRSAKKCTPLFPRICFMVLRSKPYRQQKRQKSSSSRAVLAFRD